MILTSSHPSYPPTSKAKENANDYHDQFHRKNSYITDYLIKHGIGTTTMDFDDFMALMEDIEDARAADQAYMEYLAVEITHRREVYK